MRKSTLALVAALTLPLTGAHSAPPVETHTAREASAYNPALHDIAAACAQGAAVKYVIQVKGGEQIAITMECRGWQVQFHRLTLFNQSEFKRLVLARTGE